MGKGRGREGQALRVGLASWGTTHLMVPDRALFAALIRGQTYVLAREYSAAFEIPEGHGAGTHPCGQRQAQTGA